MKSVERALGIAVLIAISASHAWAQDAAAVFASPKDALVFIDRELDSGNWKALNQSLDPPLRLADTNRNYWPELKKARGVARLANLAPGPDTLTSSASEIIIRVPDGASIGGSRIKLIRADLGWWRINAVYIVR